jgi:hypothetical protein
VADLLEADGFLGKGICPALAWGEFGEAGWNRHVVESVLKSGVEEDATAYVRRINFAGDSNSGTRRTHLHGCKWFAGYSTDIAFF